jgi:hypothetical protein
MGAATSAAPIRVKKRAANRRPKRTNKVVIKTS